MIFVPQLLKDRLRLQEIYDLRVTAWENSNDSEFVTRHSFPNGWKDRFDDETHHWVVEQEKTIIASARICLLNSITELDEDLSAFNLPNRNAVAYFSRLVVHPEYRSKGLAKMLDKTRIEFLNNNSISFAIGFAGEERVPQLEIIGFRVLGVVSHLYGSNSVFGSSIALIFEKACQKATR